MPPSNSLQNSAGPSPALRPQQPRGTPAPGPPGPCPRPPAAPTHRAAVRRHIEDEERAARRVRGVGPFPHLVLLHQQAVRRALTLRELHLQSCEGRTTLRRRCRPGTVPGAAPHPRTPPAPLCPSPVYPAGAAPAARAMAAAIFSARGGAGAAGSCGSPGAARPPIMAAAGGAAAAPGLS